MNERDIERLYLSRFGVRLEPAMRRYVLDSLRTGQAAPGVSESLTILGECPPPSLSGQAMPVMGLSEPVEDDSQPS